MDSTTSLIVAAIIGGLFVLCAAFIGFEMSDRATRRRENDAAALHAHRVRAMLRLEVEGNLDAVRDLLHTLEYGLDGSEIERQFQARLRLIGEEGARWGHLMWERLAPDLPGVLDETLIRQVYSLYADLATVTRLRARLADELPADLVDTYRFYRQSRPDALGTELQQGLSLPPVLGSQVGSYNGATADDYTACLNILNKWQGQHNLITDTPLPTPSASAWVRLTRWWPIR